MAVNRGGTGAAETWWGQTHDRPAIEERSQSVPDGSGLGITVDEAHSHALLLCSKTRTSVAAYSIGRWKRLLGAAI